MLHYPYARIALATETTDNANTSRPTEAIFPTAGWKPSAMRLVFHTQENKKSHDKWLRKSAGSEMWQGCGVPPTKLNTGSAYPWLCRLAQKRLRYYVLLVISSVRCVLTERQKPGPMDEW